MTTVRGWWEACVWWLRRCGFMGRKYVVERTAVMTDIKDSSGSRRLLVEVDDRERVVYEYRRLLKCTRTSCLSGAGTHGEAPQRRRRAGAGGCYVGAGAGGVAGSSPRCSSFGSVHLHQLGHNLRPPWEGTRDTCSRSSGEGQQKVGVPGGAWWGAGTGIVFSSVIEELTGGSTHLHSFNAEENTKGCSPLYLLEYKYYLRGIRSESTNTGGVGR